MANPVKNLPFRVDGNTTNAPITPFTLAPGQVSAFDAVIKIDYTSYTPDASGVMISAVNFSGSQMNGSYAGSYPVALYSLADANGITFNMTATGASVYVATQHTGTFIMSAMSPWVSGNNVNGTSDAAELVDFSLVPAVCSLNIAFSTTYLSPNPVGSFVAVASGSDSKIGLTWTTPVATTGALSSIRVNRTTGRMPSATDDGTTTILSSAATSSLTDVLDNVGGVTYGFAAWNYDTYNQASVIATASAVSVNASPSAITNFTATSVTSNTVGLTWTNPAGSEGVTLSAVQINYTLGRNPSALNDGTITTLASSVTSLSVAGLTDGVMYGFAARAKDDDGQFSSPVYASVSPVWQGQAGGRVWASHEEHMRMRNLGYI